MRLLGVAQALCLAKNLTLGSEVGAGAFKSTFEVRESDGTARALKIYKKAGADARAQREVDAIKRCSHPGIARLDVIETFKHGNEEYVYLLEEFLSGGTLTAHLAGGNLVPRQVRELAASLVSAVSHIAALNLVHRDLKPDNIMYRKVGGELVIVDFGLVRDLQMTSLTKTWQPQGPGTPFFAAPEQLNNEKAMIDWRTDQFALGVVLTICGFGRHPYAISGASPARTIERVANREEPADEFIDWTIRAGLTPLARMVKPWPINRYRTPMQLANSWELKGVR
jgi:serine/threonine protein kinase